MVKFLNTITENENEDGEEFKFTCPDCAEQHNDENVNDLCDSCREEYETCPDCNDLNNDGNTNGLCDNCYNEYGSCEHCDDLVRYDEMTLVHVRSRRSYHNFNEVHVCENCADNNFTICDDCGEYYPNDEIHETQNRNNVCSECIDENYTSCSSCSDLIHVDNVRYNDDDGENYCEECYVESTPSKSDLIEGYGYKPDTEFFMTYDEEEAEEAVTDFYGTELEVDNGDDLDGAVDELDGILAPNDEFYFKEDGSLTKSGFEIVSHPLSYAYHMTCVDYEEAFKHLQRNGFKSHDAGTCGLHIHVSKIAFGRDENKMMYNLSRFMYMFEKFYNEFFTLTRRTQAQMDRWARRYGIEFDETPNDMIKKANETGTSKDRYYLVNFKNTHTVEVRAFRGTLNANTYKASLQLVKSFRDIACSHQDLTKFTWEDFKKYCKAKGFDELTNYIIEKGL